MTRAWTDIFARPGDGPAADHRVHRGRGRPDGPDEAATARAIRQRDAAAKATATTPLAAAGLSAVRAVDRAAAASASPPPASWPASRPGGSPGCAASAACPGTSWSAGPASGASDSTSPRRSCPCRAARHAGQSARSRSSDRNGPLLCRHGRPLRSTRPSRRSRSPRTRRPRAPVRRRRVRTASSPTRRSCARSPASPAFPAGAAVSPWAGQQEIARATGMPVADVAAAHRTAPRPLGQVGPSPATGPRRRRGDPRRARPHPGRGAAVAAGLLARRGSELGDPAERLRVAAICVRAAVDTEERRDRQLTDGTRRMPSRKADASGERGPRRADRSTPRGGHRPACRGPVRLRRAPRRAGRPPRRPGTRCPASPRSGRRCATSTLRWRRRYAATCLAVRHRPGAARRRRVGEGRRDRPSGAVSPRPVARTRPEDLPGGQLPRRRVRRGAARRVLARFPDLATPPRAGRHRATCSRERLRRQPRHRRPAQAPAPAPSSAARARLRPVGWQARSPAARDAGAEAAEHARQRLDEARRRGGFVAVKTSISRHRRRDRRLTRLDGVTPVNVTAGVHYPAQGASSKTQGRPAGRPSSPPTDDSASPAAKTGFARLLTATWERLEVAHPCGSPKRYRPAARRDPAGPLHRRRRAAREAG